MSFIGSMFDGSKGAGFQAGGTNILAPSTVDQANQTFGQAQTGLSQQQAFLQALQAQNGIQNQAQVYNQLQGVANGTGPNPAQAQLAQATGANTANQAALMAGQRGAGANVGLMARQAAMQGGQNQQNAAGQAATLQANQSMNALNSLAGISGQQVANQANAVQGYSQAAQGLNNNVLSGIGAQNNANVGMQSSVNSGNAGIAQTNAKGQYGLLSGAGSALALAHGGAVQHYAEGTPVGGAVNFNVVAPGSSQPLNPQGMAIQNAFASPAPFTGNGPKSKVGQYLSSNNSAPATDDPEANGRQVGSALGKGFSSGINAIGNMFKDPNAMTDMSGGPAPVFNGADDISRSAIAGEDAPDLSKLASIAPMLAAKGGKVPALLSPGEKYLPPEEAKEVAKGEKSVKAAGKTVPGKPDGKKDSLKNDTVPASLEEGGFVIPNSIMQGKDPERGAAAFVRAHMSKSQKLKSGKK